MTKSCYLLIEKNAPVNTWALCTWLLQGRILQPPAQGMQNKHKALPKLETNLLSNKCSNNPAFGLWTMDAKCCSLDCSMPKTRKNGDILLLNCEVSNRFNLIMSKFQCQYDLVLNMLLSMNTAVFSCKETGLVSLATARMLSLKTGAMSPIKLLINTKAPPTAQPPLRRISGWSAGGAFHQRTT